MAAIDLDRRLQQAPFLVVDGGLSNEVEAQGARLDTALWSARLLLDDPLLIKQAHRAYFDAGADIAITASYQASIEGYRQLGLSSEQARDLIKLSVQLAREAAAHRQPPLVAGSIGPYGAFLADGSEYTGDYQTDTALLTEFHRPRLEALLEAGVDVLAIETQPSFAEIKAVVTLLDEYPDARAWVSMSARDGNHINDGTPISEVARWLENQPQVVAIGVNCTAPEHIGSLLQALANASSKPLLVYPNAGQAYDPEHKCWVATNASSDRSVLAQLVREWHRLGARLIGGCCQTTPTDIAAINGVRNSLDPQ